MFQAESGPARRGSAEGVGEREPRRHAQPLEGRGARRRLRPPQYTSDSTCGPPRVQIPGAAGVIYPGRPRDRRGEAVFAAYSWKPDHLDDEIQAKLLELDLQHEPAE